MKTKLDTSVRSSVNIILFVITVILLIHPAIANRFPIIHPDTGTYIDSGFNNIVPIDRPIIYGLFVRHISMAHTLWFVIIFQAILVATSILLLFNYVFRSQYSILKTFITVTIITILTGVSYYCSQVMPDIFSALGLIGIYVFFINDKLPKWVLILYGIIIVFSSTSHLSNLTVYTLMVVSFVFLALIFRKRKWISLGKGKLINISIVLIFSWFTLPFVNVLFGDEFKISKAKNVIIAANLLESGIMLDYMEEYCAEKNYDFCKYLEDLKGPYRKAPIFVWNSNSPLYRDCKEDIGWRNCWIKRHKEFDVIINDMFKTPKYRKRIISKMIRFTSQQLYTFHNSTFSPLLEGNSPHWNIKFYLKRDLPSYMGSCQSGNGLKFYITDKLQIVSVSFSFLLMIMIFVIPRLRQQVSYNYKFLFWFVILAFLINAFICGSLSHVVGRYQGRIIWLLPLTVIVTIINYTGLRFTAVKE